MGQRMKDEDGAASAVDAFHRRDRLACGACSCTRCLHHCSSTAQLACASGPAPHTGRILLTRAGSWCVAAREPGGVWARAARPGCPTAGTAHGA